MFYYDFLLDNTPYCHFLCYTFLMIQLSHEYKRNLLFTNTNKALLEIVKNASPEQLNQLHESKDPKAILTSLFQEKLTHTKSDHLLAEILKSSPHFKTMGNFNDQLKTLVNELKSSPHLSTAALEKFLHNSSSLTPQALQKQIHNSGIFMESKIASYLHDTSQPFTLPNLTELKQEISRLYAKLASSPLPQSETLLDGMEKFLNTFTKMPAQELKTLIQEFQALSIHKDVNEPITKLIPKLTALIHAKEPPTENTLPQILSDDLKSSLMTLADELQHSDSPSAPKQLELIDKLLLQIDYHQLQSHLHNATSLYFPFAWEQLEEGSLLFKKKDAKKSYCSVNLRFKEYGELSILMSLYDTEQLDIHFHTEKPSLNTLIKEHLAELRELLSQSGFHLKTIRVHEENESQTHLQEAYGEDGAQPHGGFEVTV